jgi:hypothetical protein
MLAAYPMEKEWQGGFWIRKLDRLRTADMENDRKFNRA